MPQDRAPISDKTIKLLFALSGNRCAFPGCDEKLIYNYDTVLAIICHIEGYRKNSARYNPAMTDQERNSFENLVLMCAKHHTIIDTHPDEFTTEKLREIKKKHEAAIAAQGVGTGSPTPHQIPSPPQDFTGREAELKKLLKAHNKGIRTFVIHSLGGFGKTALAYAFAQDLDQHYPDGQINIDLLGTHQKPLPSSDAMVHVIRAWNLDEKIPDDPQDLMDRYQSVLHDRQVLLLLDNARDLAQVEPLVPKLGCCLIVTSRWLISLPEQESLPLGVLSHPKAIKLLRSKSKRLDHESASILAGYCGDIPQALHLSAGALASSPSMPVADFLKKFAQTQTRLKLTGMQASLQVSYDLLDPALQMKLRQLSVFPAPFDRPAAAAVCAVDEEAAQEALDALLCASLLEWDPGSGFRLHDLVREFAAGQLSVEERYGAALRHAGHYLEVARQADELYIQGGEHLLQGLRLFDRHWAHIQAGQAWAAAGAEADEDAARLCNEYPDAAAYLLDLRLHAQQRIIWLQAAIKAARRLGLKSSEGNRLGSLGLAYADLGQVEKAIEHYQEALVIDRKTGDRRGEGNHLGHLGVAYTNLGQVEKAIQLYEEALVIAREIGDRRGEGKRLGNLGLAYAALGQVEKAIEHYQQALVIAREIGDRRGEGAHLGNLGLAYAALGQVDKAVEYYEEALVIAREIGDLRNEEVWLGNLGLAYADLGRVDKAIQHYQQALVIAREIGDRQGEGNHLANLAYTYASQDHLVPAVQLASRALAIFTEIKSPNRKQMEQLLSELRDKMGEAAFNAAQSAPNPDA